MKTTVYAISEILGLNRLASVFHRLRPVILTLHGVTSDLSNVLCNAESLHLHLPIFERLMAHLARNYRVVPLAQIRDWLEGSARVPERAVAITFDDGFRDVLTEAAPVLRRLDLPATMFVATDFVFKGEMLWPDRLCAAFALTREKRLEVEVAGETRRYDLTSRNEKMRARAELTALAKLQTPEGRLNLVADVVNHLEVQPAALMSAWDGFRPLEPADLNRLNDFGITVGSHSCSHPVFSRLTPADQTRELTESRRILENTTGDRCDLFAYPNGSIGDFNGQTRRSVIDAGYRAAFTTIKRRVSREDDLFEMPRVTVTHNRMTTSEFSSEVAGFTGTLRTIRDHVRRSGSKPAPPNARVPEERIV